MNPLFRFSFKVIVVQFYKRNAGLLFFFFIVFFGIIPPYYLLTTHIALINAQINSILLTLLVLTLWTSYAIRCVNFIQKVILKYWDSTTNLYRSYSNQRLFPNSLLTFNLIFLPISLYGIVVAWVAFSQGTIVYGIYILSSLTVITLSGVTYTIRLVNGKTTFVLSFKKLLPSGSYFNFYWLLMSHFWHERRGIILIMKIASYVGFNLFIIRNSDIFREDYFSLFLLLIGALNSLMIFSGQKFLEEKAQFLRNLPLSVARRSLMIFATGMIYFVPELLFLIGMSHEILTYQSKLIYYLLLVSHFSLLFSLLYSEKFGLWKFIKYNIVMLVGYQILISLIPLYVVIIINLILSYVIFQDGFLKYEHETNLIKE